MIKEVRDEVSGMSVTNIPGHIFSGGVDMHVHFRDPGKTEKEDFRTGSKAAIFGGTTTVCDMPNNKTPITDARSFKAKLSEIEKKSYVDFGTVSSCVHSYSSRGNWSALRHVCECSVRLFLTQSYPPDI